MISTNRPAFCKLSLRYEFVHFPGGVVLKQENLFTITTKAYFIQKVSIDQDLEAKMST
jgi:hypothetical protein